MVACRISSNVKRGQRAIISRYNWKLFSDPDVLSNQSNLSLLIIRKGKYVYCPGIHDGRTGKLVKTGVWPRFSRNAAIWAGLRPNHRQELPAHRHTQGRPLPIVSDRHQPLLPDPGYRYIELNPVHAGMAYYVRVYGSSVGDSKNAPRLSVASQTRTPSNSQTSALRLSR